MGNRFGRKPGRETRKRANAGKLTHLARGRAFWGGLCLFSALALVTAREAAGQEQRLLLTIDGHAATARDSIESKEILSLVPGRDPSVALFLDQANWPVLLGDQNHNGRFDDSPARIDALEIADPSSTITDPTVFDLVLSLSSDRVFQDGTLVHDGDAFALLPGGGVKIVIPESQFRSWVDTGDDVDLDALAFLSDGSVAFSFDEPVACADRGIVSRNGGNPFIDDESIFVHRPGQSRAELYRTGPEIVTIVNRVLGTSYRSVLDVQGLAEDPSEPGALVFSTGVFTVPGASVLFTTARGGDIATLNGVPLLAPVFGFLGPVDIGDFTIVQSRAEGAPVSLGAQITEPSRSVDGHVSLRLEGSPAERVRLLVSRASLPLPVPRRSASFGGAGYLFLDASDPLFVRTASLSRLSFVLDGQGTLDARLPLRSSAPVGIALLFQAVSEDRRQGSYPVAIRILP